MTIKVRVALGEIEEIYEVENYADAVEKFVDQHDISDMTDATVTEVGTFYDRNRQQPHTPSRAANPGARNGASRKEGAVKMTINELATLIGSQIKENNRTQAQKSPYMADIKTWDTNIGNKICAKVVPGKKYTKIDVCTPQQSGRYMIVNETGEIFGIKAYGVIHRGHAYGTLDTANEWYWGEYSPIKIKEASPC